MGRGSIGREKKMIYIILAIIAYLVIRSFSKSSAEKTTQEVMSGQHDDYVRTVFNAFSAVRQYHEEFGSGIAVTDHFVVVNGKPTGEVTKLLAVRVDDDTGKGIQAAKRLGMRTTCVNGKYIHDMMIKGGLSRAEKRAVLSRLASMIMSQYPNDHVEVKDTLLYDYVEMRHLMEMLGKK